MAKQRSASCQKQNPHPPPNKAKSARIVRNGCAIGYLSGRAGLAEVNHEGGKLDVKLLVVDVDGVHPHARHRRKRPSSIGQGGEECEGAW